MNLNLKDKVYIVTGGASGIGEAIVQLLLSEEAIPVILDRSQSAIDKITNGLTANHLSIVKSLESTEDCQSVVDEVMSKLGRVDGLVNNAGINDGAGLQGDPAAFRKSLDNNLMHYFDMAHFALPALKDTKGAIVNVASKTALTGQGGTSGYVASKGAQLSLTREWAAELAPLGIRVNAVIPAEVQTPAYDNWLSTFENPKEKLNKIVSKIPFGQRMTKPQEIANTVVFLLSDASGHTTGQWLFVDGGYVHLDRSLT